MNHPEYLNRLASLAAARQIEIVGGGFSEPILAMLPSRDRIGQIRQYNQWLEQRLQTTVTGMWVAERVWDSSMVADLANAGIDWTILDDFHFKAAGLTNEVLDRYWTTESDGRTLAVFPGSEHCDIAFPLQHRIPRLNISDFLPHADKELSPFLVMTEKSLVSGRKHIRPVFKMVGYSIFFVSLRKIKNGSRCRYRLK